MIKTSDIPGARMGISEMFSNLEAKCVRAKNSSARKIDATSKKRAVSTHVHRELQNNESWSLCVTVDSLELFLPRANELLRHDCVLSNQECYRVFT